MILCNLSARIFVRSLILQLSREIGLKSLTHSRLFTFGTRMMKDPLILSKLILHSKKSRQRAQKSFFIKGQHFLMKSPLKPSRPRALLVGSLLIKESISSLVKEETKLSRSTDKVMRLGRSKPMSGWREIPILFLKSFRMLCFHGL